MIYRSHAPRLCPNYSQHYPEGNTTPDLFADIESGGDKAKNKALADISDTGDAGEERARGQDGERGQPAAPGNTNSPPAPLRCNSQDSVRSLRHSLFSSSGDIKSGYWQVKMELEVRGMAAFDRCLGPPQLKVIYQEGSKPPAGRTRLVTVE